jgi:hypothetical protein
MPDAVLGELLQSQRLSPDDRDNVRGGPPSLAGLQLELRQNRLTYGLGLQCLDDLDFYSADCLVGASHRRDTDSSTGSTLLPRFFDQLQIHESSTSGRTGSGSMMEERWSCDPPTRRLVHFRQRHTYASRTLSRMRRTGLSVCFRAVAPRPQHDVRFLASGGDHLGTTRLARS